MQKEQQQCKQQELLSSLPFDSILEILAFVPCHFESVSEDMFSHTTSTLTFPKFPYHRTMANKVKPIHILGSQFIKLFFARFKEDPCHRIFFLYGAVEYTIVNAIERDLLSIMKRNCSVVSLIVSTKMGPTDVNAYFCDNRILQTFRMDVNNLSNKKLPQCTKTLIYRDVINNEFVVSLLSGLSLISLDVQLESFGVLNTICDHLPNLVHLGVNSQPPTTRWIEVLSGLSKLKHLQSLKIGLAVSASVNQNELVQQIAENCPKLDTLNIYSANMRSDDLYSIVFTDLSPIEKLKLKQLFLPHTFIRGNTMKRIQTMNTLKRFSFASSSDSNHLKVVKQLLANSNSLTAIKISWKVPNRTEDVFEFLKKCQSSIATKSSIQVIAMVLFHSEYMAIQCPYKHMQFWTSIPVTFDYVEMNLLV
jgi:hypothetical protein